MLVKVKQTCKRNGAVFRKDSAARIPTFVMNSSFYCNPTDHHNDNSPIGPIN